ncbi:MAG: polysaccharide deacetylase, partial [Pseudomonadota bacterium]
MSSWDALTRELDAWADAGQQAALWWRDDDAIIPTRALDQLIDIAGLYQAPLTLAVIPARTTKMLFHTLKGHSHIRVAQHGYAHVNNAGPGQKKIELGGGFDDQRLMRDLKIGRDRLSEIFEAPVTMLVPPWNRIEERVIKQLPALGYRTLSAFAQK